MTNKKKPAKKDKTEDSDKEDFETTGSEDESSESTKKGKTGKKDDLSSSISDTIAEIKSRFGNESIMKLGEKPKVDVDAIPTGSIGLDAALGVGGVPRGRIIEIFGPESSGKTTLALHIIAEAQKKNGVCAYIDAEHAMDPDYAQR